MNHRVKTNRHFSTAFFSWALGCASLLLGLLSSFSLTAQADAYPFNFRYLSKDHGLPHNYCHTALRDRRGFLWFGTQDGLARYDGVRFKVYSYQNDSTGLSAPTVYDLEEDHNGQLWIATIGGGLNCFDPLTETFRWFQNNPLDAHTLPGNDLTNLLLDADGSIWVGGLSSGLSRMDPRTGRCTNFALAENLTTAEDQLLRNSVKDIAADSQDSSALWLAANNGIFRFDKRSGQLRHFPAVTPCNDVLADTPGLVWVATDGGGIALVDKQTGNWRFFPPIQKDWAARNLATNLIADISRKSDHEFWVASLDLGFGIFDLETKQYRFFNTQSKLLAGQTSQSSNGLYRDPTGLLWIFNHKNGISLLSQASNIFDYTPLPSEGCENSTVNEPQDFAWNANRQELYVVTNGCRGLYVYEPVQRVEPVHLSGQSPFRLKYSIGPVTGATAFFRRVLIDRQGQVWIGAQPTGSGGSSLYTFSPEKKRLSAVQFPGAAQLQTYPVNDLVEDYQGNIWVATTRGGLFRINTTSKQIDHFLEGNGFDGTRMQIVDLVCLFAPAEVPDKGSKNKELRQVEEQVWFSTKEAGVFCYYPVANRFIRYGHQPGAAAGGLVEDHVTAIEAGADGEIWVATASRGLQMIPVGAPSNAVFPHFTVKDGLAFNSIHRLALAPDGQLWIATEKGISVFRPDNKKQPFKTYDESDGLADAYLNRKGFRWCTSGEIFVGQAKGFYSFHPDAIYHNSTPPVLAFTGFDLFGKPYSTGTDLNARPEVELEHDQNFFTIHFAALSFSQSNRNQYYYQMDGVDPDWIDIGNRAEVSYTQVPPGTYRFRLRASNSSGVPSADELTMQIIINPAFYQTWWFQGMLLAGLLGLLVLYFRNRLHQALKVQSAQNELNRLRAVKAELENKALRSQMNPHFIFNALNTIEALIIEEKPDAASALLQKFSRLVRLVLENSQQPYVSISLELEALELYLQLEAIRLEHRFQYRIELDPSLTHQVYQIPPMILQPFAENAILHGLRHLTDREGLLEVRLKLAPVTIGKPRLLVCEIEDNGIGRTESAAINARSQIRGKKQSLGSRLTTERVELLNQTERQDYTVKIVDFTGPERQGTLVTITLPLEFREELTAVKQHQKDT